MSDAGERVDSAAGAQPSSATPRSLLERIRRNDARAWERLVGLYTPLLLHWCRRWGLRQEDAVDVLQEVFRAVASHIDGFRKKERGDTFRGWLRTILRSKVLDHFRRRQREPDGIGGTDAQRRFAQRPGPVEAEEAAGEDNAERALLHRALELIRGEFEERTWRAFWRTMVEGRSPREVGEELGMSPGAVRVAKSRVLHRLRDTLGDLG